jgi:hypothetical protein
MIQYRCKQSGKRLESSDSSAGQTDTCDACGTANVVPALEGAAARRVDKSPVVPVGWMCIAGFLIGWHAMVLGGMMVGNLPRDRSLTILLSGDYCFHGGFFRVLVVAAVYLFVTNVFLWPALLIGVRMHKRYCGAWGQRVVTVVLLLLVMTCLVQFFSPSSR